MNEDNLLSTNDCANKPVKRKIAVSGWDNIEILEIANKGMYRECLDCFNRMKFR